MTRLLASAAACLAFSLAAPVSFAAPVAGIAPIAMDGGCGSCKGKDAKPKEEKPATNSVGADRMGGECGGCKGKDKPKGDEKPAAS